MKTLRLTITILAALWLCMLTCLAEDRITMTVTVTNLPVTGDAWTNNGVARYWTNYSSALTIITNVPAYATNNLIQRSVTNLYDNVLSYQYSGNLFPRWLSATQFSLLAQWGDPLEASAGAWATFSYSTQTTANAYPVTVPLGNQLTAGQATNIASLLLSDLSSMSTNLWASNALALARFVASNGVFYGRVSNSAAIGGNAYRLTNGWYVSPKLSDPTLTNGANYGDAFSSPGSANFAEQYGFGAEATGTLSLAVGTLAVAGGYASAAIGNGAHATGARSTAFGVGARATNESTVAIGNTARAEGSNSLAIGKSSSATHSNSVAFGNNSATTEDNQLLFGNSAHNVTIPGVLNAAMQTNSVFVGTNQFAGSIGLSASAVTSIADGNNTIAIPDGATFVTLSAGAAPTATWTNCAMSGALWDGRLLILDNATGQSMTIAHASGFDGTVARRIITSTAADVVTTGRRVTIWIYSTASGRWLLLMGG